MRSIWEELRKGVSPDLIAAEQDELLAGMEAAFRALGRLSKASAGFQAAFPLDADLKSMDPAASADAVAAAPAPPPTSRWCAPRA